MSGLLHLVMRVVSNLSILYQLCKSHQQSLWRTRLKTEEKCYPYETVLSSIPSHIVNTGSSSLASPFAEEADRCPRCRLGRYSSIDSGSCLCREEAEGWTLHGTREKARGHLLLGSNGNPKASKVCQCSGMRNMQVWKMDT